MLILKLENVIETYSIRCLRVVKTAFARSQDVVHG